MTDNTLTSTLNSGAKVMQGIAAKKEAVTDALAEGKDTVRQFVRQTRHKAEDLMDEATHNIKRSPIGSVMMAFGVGVLFGLVVSRNGRG